jgi:hypothetical protein
MQVQTKFCLCYTILSLSDLYLVHCHEQHSQRYNFYQTSSTCETIQHHNWPVHRISDFYTVQATPSQETWLYMPITSASTHSHELFIWKFPVYKWNVSTVAQENNNDWSSTVDPYLYNSKTYYVHEVILQTFSVRPCPLFPSFHGCILYFQKMKWKYMEAEFVKYLMHKYMEIVGFHVS